MLFVAPDHQSSQEKNSRHTSLVDLEIKLQIGGSQQCDSCQRSEAAKRASNISFCYRATQLFTSPLVTAISNVCQPY